jgi:excisionase family DNA binding protein
MQQKIKEADERLLSVKEVCKRLGIGHWAVYQQIHQHKLKSVKIGKRRLISTRAIEEFIANQEQYGT